MENEVIKKQERKDVAFAVFSNLFALLTSVCLGFIVPKYVSMDSYSLYKTFALYSGFVGFFHFGFINGIYLKYGNLSYDELPKNRFAGFSLILFISQLIVQGILFLVLLLIKGSETFTSPFFFVIVNIFFINLNSYFMHVNQFTKRFRVDALILLLQNVVLLLGTLSLLIYKVDNYIFYVGVVTLVNVFVFISQLIYNIRIVVLKNEKIQVTAEEVKDRIKHGFFIMISEFMGILVVTIDSVIVNLFLPSADFSVYALSIAVITILYQLTSFFSKLIFPFLKRVDEKDYLNVYRKMMKYIMIYAAGIGGIAFMAALVVPLFLPEYKDSVIIIRILGLTVLFKGVQELVCVNFFKTLNLEKIFARINFIAIVFAAVSDLVAFWLFKSKESVAIASVISFGIWFVISDIVLKGKLQLRVFDINSLVLLGMIVLYLACMFLLALIGIAVYYGVILLFLGFVLFASRKKNINENNRS